MWEAARPCARVIFRDIWNNGNPWTPPPSMPSTNSSTRPLPKGTGRSKLPPRSKPRKPKARAGTWARTGCLRTARRCSRQQPCASTAERNKNKTYDDILGQRLVWMRRARESAQLPTGTADRLLPKQWQTDSSNLRFLNIDSN